MTLLCRVTEIRQHGIDGHFAGDFACGLSTHAIAHDVDTVAHVVPEVIFVVAPNAAYVGASCNLYHESHAVSLRTFRTRHDILLCFPRHGRKTVSAKWQKIVTLESAVANEVTTSAEIKSSSRSRSRN